MAATSLECKFGRWILTLLVATAFLNISWGAAVVQGGTMNFPAGPADLGVQAKVEPHPMFDGKKSIPACESLSESAVDVTTANDPAEAHVPPLRKPEIGEEAEEAPVAVKVAVAKDARKTSALASAQAEKVMVPVYFSLSDIPEVEDVTVCGSWSGWMEHYKLVKNGNDFDGVVDLPVGKHQFKFIIDGDWTTSGQWPISYDKEGQTNNVIDVAMPKYTKGVSLRKFHNEVDEANEPAAAPTLSALDTVEKVLLFPFKTAISLVLFPFRCLFSLFGKK
eukprot:CAMPEP_0181292730 /NCGR_PEP_ID=MMETSP1101-20121128/2673_1 /TAXON_ID=46948 /ORGANISM="Rhodomonas abbreviata, Strain Caron Lab Isolate" /LENGTH=277 /DNA_ID=CAMNT_0023397241 /DNA_START=33 /DNA_END=866 /DNA_ORIENTATION=-